MNKLIKFCNNLFAIKNEERDALILKNNISINRINKLRSESITKDKKLIAIQKENEVLNLSFCPQNVKIKQQMAENNER